MVYYTGDKDLHSRALCEVLLKHGAQVNTPDNRGATPLLVCAASGRWVLHFICLFCLNKLLLM